MGAIIGYRVVLVVGGLSEQYERWVFGGRNIGKRSKESPQIDPPFLLRLFTKKYESKNYE